MNNKSPLFVILVLTFACILAAVIYYFPPVHENVAWRLEKLWASVQRAVAPSGSSAYVPEQLTPTLVTATPEGMSALTPTPTIALITPTPNMPPTAALPPTQTLTPTPLPAQAMLKGVVQQLHSTSNVGPANLAMALSFWGWKGSQADVAAVVSPNKLDKNVMLYELESFVDGGTDFNAVVRVGGTLSILKAFLSAGYPVIVERGFESVRFNGWLGHYQVLVGYDDANSRFTIYDAYSGPNRPLPYEELERDWRAFNYTYMVIYPPNDRRTILDILGLDAYDNFNYRTAQARAIEEAKKLNGRDLFFALFNQGSSLVLLQDYGTAATAYDAAFANYDQLSEKERPWRILWYQTGPYFAYYYSGRFEDVINLATTTLEDPSEPVLEESFFWRGRARLSLNDRDGAIENFRLCLDAHPEFQPCVDELTKLGEEP